MSGKVDLLVVSGNLLNGNYLPEQLPPMMTAMIVYIRELEIGLRSLCDEVSRNGEESDIEDLRAILAKGVVLL